MRRLIVALTFAMAALGSAPASAQNYPTKPIRVIVPFAAGGAVDVLARLVSAKMSESVGLACVHRLFVARGRGF